MLHKWVYINFKLGKIIFILILEGIRNQVISRSFKLLKVGLILQLGHFNRSHSFLFEREIYTYLGFEWKIQKLREAQQDDRDSLTQSCKWHMLVVVNINTLVILFASPKTFPTLRHTYRISIRTWHTRCSKMQFYKQTIWTVC